MIVSNYKSLNHISIKIYLQFTSIDTDKYVLWELINFEAYYKKRVPYFKIKLQLRKASLDLFLNKWL